MKGQEMTQKQKEYEENKVEIFTLEERDNIQMWVQEEVEKMGLSEEEISEYNNILLYYLGKIRRFDDKDKGNSKEEILQKLDQLIIKQNADVKEVLNEEQYEMHLEFYDKMILMMKNRIAEFDY
jgi:hypothetical protein